MMLIYVAMVTGALANANPAAWRKERRWWTTAPPAPSTKNLDGKMFTLSRNMGGISFFPPNYHAGPSTSLYPTRPYTSRPYPTRPYTTRPYPTRPYTTRPYTTRPYTTRPYTHVPTTTTPHATTTTTNPWTTASPTRGVSVCLRFLTDFQSGPVVFKLSPSRNPLRLAVDVSGIYELGDTWGYLSVRFKPIIRLWKNIEDNIWKDVCLTLDSVKKVAQVFTRSGVSIRKTFDLSYDWAHEPVIDVSGFDGQVTDLQLWDYPLSYREIRSYLMIPGMSRGSALTWSHVSYAPRGDVLLEDVYERQAGDSLEKRRRKGLRWKQKTSESESERSNRL